MKKEKSLISSTLLVGLFIIACSSFIIFFLPGSGLTGDVTQEVESSLIFGYSLGGDVLFYGAGILIFVFIVIMLTIYFKKGRENKESQQI